MYVCSHIYVCIERERERGREISTAREGAREWLEWCSAPASPPTSARCNPLFLSTYPYIAHCTGACSAKGEWSLSRR